LTLLLALANERHAVMVADRRVTSSGRLVDNEHNKLCVLFCDDAKMAVAFTGLATFRAFDTSTWIANTLSEIGARSGDLASMLGAFSMSAQTTFEPLSAATSIETTFLFCGFVYTNVGPQSRVYVLSIAPTSGTSLRRSELRTYADEGCKVVAAGMTSTLPQSLDSDLRRLLQSPKISRQSTLHFAVRHMQNAARSERSLKLIGQQFNAAVLEAAVDTVVTSTYHSASPTRFAYGSNVVITNGLVSLGTRVAAGDILSGPEIRKKDACWCGSGEQFRNCHLKKFGAVYLRLPRFKRPLSMVTRLEFPTARPSGKVCMVASGFS
jgi:hypothetical protein